MRFRGAIESENLDLVRDLIHSDSSLQDRVGVDGYTALQHAARHGKVKTALLLLHRGSNIGAVNRHGTALHVACYWGQTDMVQFLLSNSRSSQDVNSKDERGDTPLLSVLRSGSISAQLAVARLLLEDTRVFADTKDRNGRTPLSLAAAREDVAAVPVVKVLLGHNRIDAGARDNWERTPLSWAASRGSAGVVKTFLQHGRGVDVNAADAGGRTPLSWALDRAWGPETEMVVKLFLQHDGIDANAKDNNGRTPLLCAAGQCSPEVVNLFLRCGLGVDVNANDARGRTPLSRATSRAGGPGDVLVVKTLLGHDGTDRDAKDIEGRTPLSWAARECGNAMVVNAFLEYGVGIDLDAKDNGGRTPLSWAAEKKHSSVVQLFLQRGLGVDVNAKDAIGRTPLSWAAARELPEAALVVRLFLAHGGTEVNAKDNNVKDRVMSQPLELTQVSDGAIGEERRDREGSSTMK